MFEILFETHDCLYRTASTTLTFNKRNTSHLCSSSFKSQVVILFLVLYSGSIFRRKILGSVDIFRSLSESFFLNGDQWFNFLSDDGHFFCLVMAHPVMEPGVTLFCHDSLSGLEGRKLSIEHIECEKKVRRNFLIDQRFFRRKVYFIFIFRWNDVHSYMNRG